MPWIKKLWNAKHVVIDKRFFLVLLALLGLRYLYGYAYNQGASDMYRHIAKMMESH